MAQGTDDLRLTLTFKIAGIGIAAVFAAFLVAVILFRDANEPGEVIVAVLGPVTGVIGTLAGYVAGQTAGAAGKERAEERAARAEEQRADLVARVRRSYPEAFPADG